MRTRWIVFFALLALWLIGTVALLVFAEGADSGGVFGGMFEWLFFYAFTICGFLMLIEMAILNWCL